MTNEEIFQIALEQSAEDMNCKPEDFLKNKNVVNFSTKSPKARN